MNLFTHIKKECLDECPQRGSNSRPFAYEANALPLSYEGIFIVNIGLAILQFRQWWRRQS